MALILNKQTVTKTIFLLFLVHLFADFLTKIVLVYRDINSVLLESLNRYVKIFILIFSLYSILSLYNIEKKDLTRIVSMIFVLSIIFMVPNSFSIDRTMYFIRYLFLFVILIPFFSSKNLRINTFHLIIKAFRLIIILNLIFQILGYLFNIDLFQTYFHTQRFGYNGLIITPMQSTIFYFSSLCISIKLKDNMLIAITFFSSMLIGTKAIILSTTLLFLILIIYSKRRSYRMKIFLTILVLLFGISFITLLFNNSLFKNLITDKGLVTAIFSYRNERAIKIFQYDDYNWIHYVFGGIDIAKERSEFGFMDIFLFFGILGLIVYYYLLKFIYSSLVLSKIEKTYFFLILIIAMISGNFFNYPFNCFMFILTLFTLNQLAFKDFQNNVQPV